MSGTNGNGLGHGPPSLAPLGSEVDDRLDSLEAFRDWSHEAHKWSDKRNDAVLSSLAAIRGDLAEQRGAIMRIDALCTILTVHDEQRERDLKREHKHTDDEFRKVRKEAEQLADRLERDADSSQQRLALSSHHEIERLSRTVERAEDKIEDVAE